MVSTQHTMYTIDHMKNFKPHFRLDMHLADDVVMQAVVTGSISMSIETKLGFKRGVLYSLWHILKNTQPDFY